MKSSSASNTFHIIGILSVLIGAVHVFVPNDSPYHDPLKIVLAVGLLLICAGVFFKRASRRQRSE
ncbi:hypothetical protein [Flavilitoribacter nigricans]|uniref:Uncharacterized protein n=1 Tax=Flavilitoribacter nigricans (strain ATCC 23147 / DSM 23189 / NBRC 102662 / NCIMB 1420 / SS-2) TaxID=1122177 RepID=A0A2D0N4V7_FLAN2|nr:hypothetical protein [Flavilitoribacter nigricans]PHN03467.1 hypothetical protein CRP01_26040 [Flavilitoribacter nigricans DSM 23189 = NBRC 102662]